MVGWLILGHQRMSPLAECFVYQWRAGKGICTTAGLVPRHLHLWLNDGVPRSPHMLSAIFPSLLIRAHQSLEYCQNEFFQSHSELLFFKLCHELLLFLQQRQIFSVSLKTLLVAVVLDADHVLGNCEVLPRTALLTIFLRAKVGMESPSGFDISVNHSSDDTTLWDIGAIYLHSLYPLCC